MPQNERDCPRCDQRHRVECSYEIVSAPKQMIIWIWRYENNRVDNMLVVFFDTDWINFRGKFYRIVAAIEHLGCSLDMGHYMAYVRRENGWWKCNDSNVTPVIGIPLGLEKASILVLEKIIETSINIR